MKRPTTRRFFSLPPARRVVVLLALGLLLFAGAYVYRISRRPKELPHEEAEQGLAMVQEVLDRVSASGFGRTERGQRLTAEVRRLAEGGRIRFSASLDTEALYHKERGSSAVLYLGVFDGPDGIEWPGLGELAKPIYHEALHAVVHSKTKSAQEECDAFCAAEEAAAVVERREPRYPVTRDNQRIWEWVRQQYPDSPSDPHYEPVGYSPEELAEKTGMDYATP